MIKEIADSVYYIGVNSQGDYLFESIWPLPNGVSYNSYLIKDRCNVIVDTVDIKYSEKFIANIKEVLGDEKVDYLVVNHMEPDHSSSISVLREIYPDIKIVGNAKTLAMIKGFYGVVDNFVEIKDAEVLNIGEKNLTFYLTPMLHWPETMMTYINETKTLFSGDAFGAFGALKDGVTDRDMDISIYWDEMYRYYSNIVGKYAAPVDKAIKKLSSLEIKAICSTHGPVWIDSIGKVVELYANMSQYKPVSNRVLIAYSSMYGNTEGLAVRIKKSLIEVGVEDVAMVNLMDTDASYVIRDIFKYKGVILGSPTYNGELFPTMDSLVNQIALRGVKNRVFGCFGSFTWAAASIKKFTAFAEKMCWQIGADPIEIKQGGAELDLDAICKEFAVKYIESLKGC